MRALRELTWVEIKLFLREPLTVLFVLVLPLAVLTVLDGTFGGSPADPEVWDGLAAIEYYTPAYVALVAATVGVLSVPVQLAGYREKGVLRRLHASALPSRTLVGAHLIVATLAAGAGAAILTLLAVVAYDAPVPGDPLGVVGAFALTALAFAALGVLLGLVLPTARAAQGVGVLLFFLFLMLGGSGPPREVLPTAMQRTGEALPVSSAGDLLRGPWLDTGWDVGALAVVAGLLVASLALTGLRLRVVERAG